MGADSQCEAVIPNSSTAPQAEAANRAEGVDDAEAARGGATADSRLSRVLASLEDDKAEDVLAIDLRAKSSIADHMVIASGRSKRHVAAICDKLIERLKADGAQPRSEGLEQSDWALIDAGDVVVHVFRPEVREFYALEKMWAPDAAAAKPSAATPSPAEAAPAFAPGEPADES
ncbi:MAG: ribosome silencing factor [Pseudomonadota bacterium]